MSAFWNGLRRHALREGIDLPAELSWPADLQAHWRTPDLLLSQTCGFPLTTSLAGRVRYVGTPCYDAEGCQGPFYSSAVIVRQDDAARDLAGLAGRRVALNGHDSHSGMNALRALVAPLASEGRFFREAIETGAHRDSVEAVRTGRADVAAIDAVTWALLRRDHADDVAGLRVLAFTASAPGLPLISSMGTSEGTIERLRAAFAAACADPELVQARAGLLLTGFRVLPIEAYDVIPAMERAARALGYPALA